MDKNNLIFSKSTRLQTVDLIKIIAMICVMGLHSTFPFMSNNYSLADVIYRSCVIAIPLFFMVSGYLLLGRENITYKYSFHKIIRIIRFIAIITIAFSLCSIFIHIVKLDYLIISSVKKLIYNFLGAFVQKGNFGIFWYFGAMIIIYFALPLMNHLYNLPTKKTLMLFFVFCFTISAIFILNIKSGNNSTFESYVIQTFRLWNWLFYFFLGGIIKRYKNIFNINWLLPMIIFILLNLFSQEYFLDSINSKYCEYYYSFCGVILLCVSIFFYILNTNIKNNKIISILSSLFLPVYTFHIFIINQLMKFKEYFNMTGLLSPLLFWISVCIITILFSYIIMKIPYMKKIFSI